MNKLIFFFISVFVSTLTISIFIYINNPYKVELDKKKKYNITIDRNLERKLKVELYKRNKEINKIIFGSSRSTILETKLLGSNSFNFAFSGAQLSEIYYLLNEEIDLSSLKEVFIGLDEFMFDFEDSPFAQEINFLYNQNMYNEFKYFFSSDIIVDIYNIKKSDINYIYDLYGNKDIKNINKPSENSINKYLEKRKKEIEEGLHKFDYSKVQILEEIINLLQKNNIKINLFINPISKELRDFYKKNNPDYEKYIEHLKNYEYVNFNYDNFITNNIFLYYMDTHHYNKDVGEYMIKFIKHEQNKVIDFGKYNE